MKESEKKFITKLKKYSTNEIAKIFSSFDKYYFKNVNDEPLKHQLNIGYLRKEYYVLPWLFKDIIFYSTRYNDYREKINEEEAWDLYSLYYIFYQEIDNEFCLENYTDSSEKILSPIIYGHIQEQVKYQNYVAIYTNRFNRNYYILKNKSFNSITLNDIIYKKFGTDLKTYIHSLCLMVLLSLTYSTLNSEKALYYIDDEELYLKIINDMSVTYEECRTSGNKDIFNVSPILHTSQDEYIAVSLSTMYFNFSDKLYWIIKDYFNGITINFPVEFGNIFEDYVYEIICKQYGKSYVEKISRVNNKKSADFVIKCENYIIIIEVKSGVARANAKLEHLNIDSLKFFVKNNIVDAMQQLDSSAEMLSDNREIISFIVNYDLICVEDVLVFDVLSQYSPSNYKEDNLLLFGIDSFEEFIYEYDTIDKLEELFNSNKGKKLQVNKLLENCEIPRNCFYEDIFMNEVNEIYQLFEKKSNCKKI